MARGGFACRRRSFEPVAQPVLPVDSQQVEPRSDPETSARLERIRRGPGAGPIVAKAASEADIVEERDEFLLKQLRRSERGVATVNELVKVLPKTDPAKDRVEAVKKSLLRLKVKGLVGRTGECYSLIGAGSLPANV